MTVTLNAPQYISEELVRLTWTSDETTPTFYIYRDGELIETTQSYETTVVIEEGESPIFEVLDSDLVSPVSGYPGQHEICWWAATSAEKYRIDEYVDSAWVQRDEVIDEGQPFFSWTTRPLEDVTTHTFRVVPVGANGNDGTAQTYSIYMVRYPDPPEVSMTYSAVTRKVTIAAV